MATNCLSFYLTFILASPLTLKLFARCFVIFQKAATFKEPPDVVKAAAEPIIPSIVDSEPEPHPEEILQDKAEMITGTQAEAKVMWT